jgi:hypothetical protein
VDEPAEPEAEAEEPEAEAEEPTADADEAEEPDAEPVLVAEVEELAVDAEPAPESVPEAEAEAEEPQAEEAEADELADAHPDEVVEAAEEITTAAVDTEAADTEAGGENVDVVEADAHVEAAEDYVAVTVIDEVEAEPDAEVVEEVLVTALAPLRPGDVPQTSIAVWKPDALATIRDQIRDVQARFVDEPAEAVAQIRALVSDAVHTLADALLAEQLGSIDPHQHTDSPDTEALRVALRRYREFLDRLLAL